MDRWHGITYSVLLQNRVAWWLWKRLLCRSGWHLFDEYFSLEFGHLLICDACDFDVALDDGPRKCPNDLKRAAEADPDGEGGVQKKYPKVEATCEHDGAWLLTNPPRCSQCGKVGKKAGG